MAWKARDRLIPASMLGGIGLARCVFEGAILFFELKAADWSQAGYGSALRLPEAKGNRDLDSSIKSSAHAVGGVALIFVRRQHQPRLQQLL